MKYLKFKSIHEQQLNVGGSQVLPSKGSKELKSTMHILQTAFDKIFESFTSTSSVDLPIWAFELFDKFVKLIENRKASFNRKWNELLALVKELHFNVHVKIGSSFAEQLYGTKVSNSNTSAIAA